MIFNSTIFLFVFLPLALAIYFAFFLPYAKTSHPFWLSASNVALLAISLSMYAWSEHALVLVLVATTVVDYVCALVMTRRRRDSQHGESDALQPNGPRSTRQKAALVVSIVTNVASLAYFKYADFGLENVDRLLAALGLYEWRWERATRTALPLGLSFYTLQTLSYTIDVYRGVVRPARSFADFACYVSMFPQLVAGPIVRYKDVEKELRHRRVTLDDFGEGARRVIVGLAKKLLIADTLARPTDAIFGISSSDLTTPIAWFGALCGVLQIYFDVSAYSDMAIGLGRMLGFRFNENFDYPYAARSVTDFWRRWHISLSTWFRDYLYRGLGGGRGRGFRTHFNLLAVFALSGLWHGANWTFVVWGLAHGALLVVERQGFGLWLGSQPRLVGQLYTLLAHTLTFVFFRSDSLSNAFAFIAAMLGMAGGVEGLHPIRLYADTDVVIAFLIGALISQPLVPWIARARLASPLSVPVHAPRPVHGSPWPIAVSFVKVSSLALMAVLCALALSANTHRAFIYFRF